LYFWANVVSSSSAGLGLLLVLLVPGKLSLEMTLLTQIIATFSAALFGVILIARKHGQIEMFTCRAWLDWATGLRAGANGLASTIAFMGLYRIDLFLVVTFCDKKTSGIYAVASFTVEALQRASDWFAAVLTPMVASGLTNGHKEAFRNSGLGMGIVLGAGLIGCSFVMAGYDPFRASMGVEFSGVSRLVWLLIPKACLHCIMVSYAAVLAGRGYTFYHPASGVGAMVVLLLLGLILGPAYGPLGVIASLTVAYLVSAVIMILGTRNTLVNRPASAT
jgi:O-antigen/teichoic acid export membrane protein